MNLLVNADIPLRTVSKYKIMHDNRNPALSVT